MIVNFRQGIVQYPVGFLQQAGSPLGRFVSLNIQPDVPLILAFADGSTNYAVVQKSSALSAFGPFVTGTQDYWLFANISLTGTPGQLTWGSTTIEPIYQAATPTAGVVAGKHWFKTGPSNVPADNVTYPPYTMYLRNAGNTAWDRVVRVFLCRYENGAMFVSVSVNSSNPNPAVRFGGTQAGLVAPNTATGLIVYDQTGAGLRYSNGTFITTEDLLQTGQTFGTDVKLGSTVIQATTTASFPAYTMVRFTDFGKVTPVNLFDIDQGTTGLVEAAATVGDIVTVTTGGVVTNGGWNWTVVNAPIWITNSGTLTQTRPSVNDARPVGYALTPTSMILAEARIEAGIVDHATDTVFGAVRLTSAPVGTQGYLDINLSPSKVGADSTGLVVTNTYTATLVINGITYNLLYEPADMPNFPLTTVPTYTDLITFLNATVPASGGLNGVAVVSLVSAPAASAQLRITANSTGPTSVIRLQESLFPSLFDLFTSLAGFSSVDVPVDGYWDSVVASGAGLTAHIADTDIHVAHSTVSITAGAGLSGGGTIAATRTLSVGTNAVTNAMLRQGTALSVVGNATNALANVADIVAGVDGQVLRRSGSAVGFGSIRLDLASVVGTSVLSTANGGTDTNATPTNGQLLIGNGTNYTVATLTAGAGVAVTNGAGSVTIATQTLKGTAAFTFGAIAASATGDSTNTLTVTGAVAGDVVALGLPSTVPAGFTYVGYVSAADTVTIRAHGSAASGTNAGDANATIKVVVMKYASF